MHQHSCDKVAGSNLLVKHSRPGQGRDTMDDELDAALDVELEASFTHHLPRPPAAAQVDHGHATCSEPSSSSSAATIVSSPAAKLTFAFPDWAIDICNDAKRQKVSVLRHSTSEPPPPSGRDDVRAGSAKAAAEAGPGPRNSRKKGWKLEADSRVWKLDDSVEEDIISKVELEVANDGHLEDGSRRNAQVVVGSQGASATSCNELPDDLLTNICKRLSIRDLCSAVRTCRRWYSTGLQDDLWNAAETCTTALFIITLSKGCPRWVGVKNMKLFERVSQKFHGYRKGYEFSRYAMNSWWDLGKPDSRYPATLFRTVIQKLTVNNWSLLYEGFGVTFIDRTDWIANSIVRDFGSLEKFTSSQTSPSACSGATEGIPNQATEVNSAGHDGMLLWQAVETYWQRYKRWLTLVVSHCRELNHEVMAERARSCSWVSTPTLYDKGVICFRSQIMLQLGLRQALQAGYKSLTALDTTGCASDHQTELLKSVYHLLQELDVHDDFTLSPAGYTQEKLRRCFSGQHTMARGVSSRHFTSSKSCVWK